MIFATILAVAGITVNKSLQLFSENLKIIYRYQVFKRFFSLSYGFFLNGEVADTIE